MTPKQVELVLRKQRLQIRSALLREDLSRFAAGLRPAFSLADRGQSAFRWLQRHPLLPVAVLSAMLVARPRAVLRWAQRGFFVWQSLRKLRTLLQLPLPRIR